MSKKEKEFLELKGTRSQFTVIGKVQLPKEGIEKPEENESGTWLGVRTGFNVKTSDDNSVYVTLNGGRALKHGVLFVQSKENKPLKVPFTDRNNEEILKNVADYSFFKARINKETAINTIDYVDYTRFIIENLKDGMEVVVKGNVEYSESESNGETRVYRNLIVNNIYPNLENSENENGLQYDKRAYISQGYILTDGSLSSRFAKELKEEGQTVLSVFVPQYVSKMKNSSGQYVEYKKTIPMTQLITLKANENNLSRIVKLAESLFKLPKNKVILSQFEVDIREGFEQVETEIHLNKEMLDLIAAGIVSEEDFREAPTVNRTRVSELIFKRIILMKDDSSGEQTAKFEGYTMESLVRPTPEDEAEEQFSMEDDDDVSTAVEDDLSEFLFGDDDDLPI